MDPQPAADCSFKRKRCSKAACISGETNVNFHLFVHAHAVLKNRFVSIRPKRGNENGRGGEGGGHSWAGTHIGKCISQSISDRKFFLFDALLKGVLRRE